MVTVYGIANCDKVKKAKTWLIENNIDFVFHDFKKLGVSNQKLTFWCNKLGWQQVLNKNGLTFKKLSINEKAEIFNQDTAITYMAKSTSSIKRPILENNENLILGYLPDDYKVLF